MQYLTCTKIAVYTSRKPMSLAGAFAQNRRRGGPLALASASASLCHCCSPCLYLCAYLRSLKEAARSDIPYTRDPDPVPHTSHANSTADCRYFRPGCPTALPWWRANKPELVLYQCDRKTPAWECFKGEGCRHDSVPLGTRFESPALFSAGIQTRRSLPVDMDHVPTLALTGFGVQT